MKHLLAVLLALGSHLFAAEEPPRSAVAIGFVHLGLGATYEARLFGSTTGRVGAYGFPGLIVSELNGYSNPTPSNWSGGLAYGVRHFFSAEAFKGWHMSLELNHYYEYAPSYQKEGITRPAFDASYLGPSVAVGYQWLFSNSVTLNLAYSLDQLNLQSSSVSQGKHRMESHGYPWPNLLLGYVF